MTPCHKCINRKWLWGMLYCVLGKWSGANNERMCSEYRRKEHEQNPQQEVATASKSSVEVWKQSKTSP